MKAPKCHGALRNKATPTENDIALRSPSSNAPYSFLAPELKSQTQIARVLLCFHSGGASVLFITVVPGSMAAQKLHSFLDVLGEHVVSRISSLEWVSLLREICAREESD